MSCQEAMSNLSLVCKDIDIAHCQNFKSFAAVGTGYKKGR